MKKIEVSLILLIINLLCIYGQSDKPGNLSVEKDWKLQVSHNGHYLEQSNGTPFFWLGDTGWEMLRRLSREEMETYLENRRIKGFNVIQTVIISEFIHTDKATNFYGDSALIGDNPEKPAITPGSNPVNSHEYDYWDHIDFAVKTAENKGMYMALVPTWGEWVIPRSDKALFNTNEQAYNYGWFVGNRYKSAPNIIWILGGDRHPDERKEGVELWRSMAEGITDGSGGIRKMDGKADYTKTLMTHHSFSSSSTWFHKDDWIDFHMWGSYHAEIDNSRAFEIAIQDWDLPNPKPTINAEPCYEAHGINYAVEDNGYFTSTDVRLAAYWSVFSGSAGFTYGAQPIWQFTDATRKKHSKMTLTSWQEALDLPGAQQMQFLKKLMEEAVTSDLKPDQSVILAGEGDCGSRVCALRDKSSAYLYIPTGNQVKVRLGILDGKTIRASWLDPRTGKNAVIGEFPNSGEKVFDVPGQSKELTWLRSGRGCDWVLILNGK